MSNASYPHGSPVPIGNNYIIWMGLASLPCILDQRFRTELWRTRGEEEEEEEADPWPGGRRDAGLRETISLRGFAGLVGSSPVRPKVAREPPMGKWKHLQSSAASVGGHHIPGKKAPYPGMTTLLLRIVCQAGQIQVYVLLRAMSPNGTGPWQGSLHEFPTLGGVQVQMLFT